MSPKITRKDLNPAKLSPSKMLTRKQTMRNQRRIKNESILRISQMTQMLKSPINSKYDYESPKSSPVNKIIKQTKKKQISPIEDRTVLPVASKEVLNVEKVKAKRKSRTQMDMVRTYLPAKRKAKEEDDKESQTKPLKKEPKIVEEKKPASEHTAEELGYDSEFTMDELIRLQENDSFTEEDLMEILTCPSPVWWEDPPNEYFTEDSMPVEKEDKINKHIAIEKITEINNKDTNEGNLIKYTTKFMTKRNKLENLLNNIKIKRNNNVNNELNTKNATKRKRRKVFNKHGLIRNKITKDNNGDEIKLDDDIFFSLQKDEMLCNLENIKIPIQSNDKTNAKSTDSSEVSRANEDFKMAAPNYEYISKISRKPAEISPKSINSLIDSKDEKNKRFKIMSIEKYIDASPVSIKSFSTDTEIQEDAISDTNIKFIYEDSGSQNSASCDKDDVDSEISEEKSNNDSVMTDVITEQTFGVKIQNAEQFANKSNTTRIMKSNKVDKSNELTVTTNEDSESKPFGLQIQKGVDKTDDKQQKIKKSPRKFKFNAKDRKRHEIMTVYKIITSEQFNKDEIKSMAAKERSMDSIEKIIKSNFGESANDIKNEDSKTNTDDLKTKNDDLKVKSDDSLSKTDDLNKNLDDTKEKSDKTDIGDDPNKNQESKSNLSKICDRNAKLDSFYKKYKFSHHNKKKEAEDASKDIGKNDLEINYCAKCDPNQQKSIIIDNSKTKYCMKCSGIFETEECSYCSRKAVNSPTFLTCQNCQLHFCCELALTTHENFHNSV